MGFNIGDFLSRDIAPIAGMASTGIGDFLKLISFFQGQGQLQPGSWGKVSPEQAGGWPMPGPIGGVPGLTDYLRGVMPQLVGGPLQLGQIQLGEEAKERGIKGADWAMETIAGSPAAERLENLRSLDPTVISQLTFDKNAAAIIDNINRQARQTAETQTGAAGARGLSPDAIAAIQSGTAMTGRREALGDIAQLDLSRGMVNEEARRAHEALVGNLQSQLYRQYEPWGMAKLGLESTPTDLGGLSSAIQNQWSLQAGFGPSLTAELGNMFGGRGADLWSMFSDYQGRQDVKEAADEASPGFWEGPLGTALITSAMLL